jgi:hypothetical protein
MSTCSNCGNKLGCSCQKRVASDGKPVCANCITAYEAALKIKNAQASKPTSGSVPTNVNVFYKAP